MARYSGKGTTISWGGITITNTFSLNTGVTRDQIDVTALEDTFRTFVGAIPDGGTVTVQGWMDPDAGIISSWEEAVANDEEGPIIITFTQSPNQPTVEFNARIVNLQYEAAEGQGLRFTLGLKATGHRTFTQ